jgi:magnesium-protoporphyrin O-methyltransferase
MDACGCDDFASIFDRKTAEADRSEWRRAGPARTTRMLLDLIRPYGIPGSRVLDIGGGIGVIDHELLRAGAERATLVDASSAYLAVAREEAAAAHLLERLEIVEGDFVRRATSIEAADIVTLDRVICCYGDVEGLVDATGARTQRVLGVVMPRDRWVFRLGASLTNGLMRLRRRSYRAYAHTGSRVDGLAARHGLVPRTEQRTFWWRVVVYDRATSVDAVRA